MAISYLVVASFIRLSSGCHHRTLCQCLSRSPSQRLWCQCRVIRVPELDGHHPRVATFSFCNLTLFWDQSHAGACDTPVASASWLWRRRAADGDCRIDLLSSLFRFWYMFAFVVTSVLLRSFGVVMAQSMVIDNGSAVELRAQNAAECFKIVFIDLQQKLVSAWQEEMAKELPSSLMEQSNRTISVTACQAYIRTFLEANPVDCMVSPANSFGLMDGGLDLEISKYYGGIAKLVPVVRSALVDEWCGQQNVGTCLLVDAQKLVQAAQQGEQAKNVPRYIAHVPTMRVPKVLHPDDDIAYRCTWALLTAVRKHNMQVAKQEQAAAKGSHERINTVLCSGFGTGSGQFPLHECARQMVLAVKHFAERTWETSAEENDPRGSSGLMTLWDKAEKIEDAVCSFDKAGDTPSSSSLFERVFGK